MVDASIAEGNFSVKVRWTCGEIVLWKMPSCGSGKSLDASSRNAHASKPRSVGQPISWWCLQPGTRLPLHKPFTLYDGFPRNHGCL